MTCHKLKTYLLQRLTINTGSTRCGVTSAAPYRLYPRTSVCSWAVWQAAWPGIGSSLQWAHKPQKTHCSSLNNAVVEAGEGTHPCSSRWEMSFFSLFWVMSPVLEKLALTSAFPGGLCWDGAECSDRVRWSSMSLSSLAKHAAFIGATTLFTFPFCFSLSVSRLLFCKVMKVSFLLLFSCAALFPSHPRLPSLIFLSSLLRGGRIMFISSWAHSR